MIPFPCDILRNTAPPSAITPGPLSPSQVKVWRITVTPTRRPDSSDHADRLLTRLPLFAGTARGLSDGAEGHWPSDGTTRHRSPPRRRFPHDTVGRRTRSHSPPLWRFVKRGNISRNRLHIFGSPVLGMRGEKIWSAGALLFRLLPLHRLVLRNAFFFHNRGYGWFDDVPSSGRAAALLTLSAPPSPPFADLPGGCPLVAERPWDALPALPRLGLLTRHTPRRGKSAIP